MRVVVVVVVCVTHLFSRVLFRIHSAMALSGDELTLALLSDDRSLMLFDVGELLNGRGVPFAKVAPEGGGVLRFAWAARAVGSVLALTSTTHQLRVMTVERSTRAIGEPTVATGHCTAVCWHASRPVLAIALGDGSLATLAVTLAATPRGKPKLRALARLLPPTTPAMARTAFAHDIAWPTSHRLLAAFDRTVMPRGSGEGGGGDDEAEFEEHPIYVYDVARALEQHKETLLPDTRRIFLAHDPERHQAITALAFAAWHVALLCDTAATSVSLLKTEDDDARKTLLLIPEARIELPLDADNNDVYVVGAALDTSVGHTRVAQVASGVRHYCLSLSCLICSHVEHRCIRVCSRLQRNSVGRS